MWQWCSICHYVSQVHFQSFEHLMLFWSFIIMCFLAEKWIQTKTTMYWMLNIDALHCKPVVISLNFGFAFILKFIWLNTRLMSSISISSLFLLWIWCPFFSFLPFSTIHFGILNSWKICDDGWTASARCFLYLGFAGITAEPRLGSHKIWYGVKTKEEDLLCLPRD